MILLTFHGLGQPLSCYLILGKKINCVLFERCFSMLVKRVAFFFFFFLFYEEAIECQFEHFPLSPHFLDRPLEKEKVIPLVTGFIESLFVTVDRGSFGKGQLESPLILWPVFSGTLRVSQHTDPGE